MENQTEEGVVYARKLYSHTIAVSCNGKEYTLKASVILRRIIGEEGKPYLVKSELVETGKSTLNDGSYTSWIKVKQTWSTGEEKRKFMKERHLFGLLPRQQWSIRLFLH